MFKDQKVHDGWYTLQNELDPYTRQTAPETDGAVVDRGEIRVRVQFRYSKVGEFFANFQPPETAPELEVLCCLKGPL